MGGERAVCNFPLAVGLPEPARMLWGKRHSEEKCWWCVGRRVGEIAWKMRGNRVKDAGGRTLERRGSETSDSVKGDKDKSKELHVGGDCLWGIDCWWCVLVRIDSVDGVLSCLWEKKIAKREVEEDRAECLEECTENTKYFCLRNMTKYSWKYNEWANEMNLIYILECF